MGWQSGTFHRLFSWTADANAGFDILPDRMDADTNDIVGGISNTLTRDGQNTPLGNLPMAGFKHLAVAAATSPSDYARFDQVVKTSGDGAITGNLSVTGDLAVGGTTNLVAVNCDTVVANRLTSNGDLAVAGTTNLVAVNCDTVVANRLTSNGDLAVGGITNLVAVNCDTVVANRLTSNGNLAVAGSSTLTGPVFCNALTAAGAAAAASLSIAGPSSLSGHVNCTDLTVNGNLAVAGTTSLSGHVNCTDLTVNGNLAVAGTTSLNAISAAGLNISGGASLGSLFVAGTATVDGALTVSNAAQLNNTVTIGGTLTAEDSRIIVSGGAAPSLAIINTVDGSIKAIWNASNNLQFGSAGGDGAPQTAFAYFTQFGDFTVVSSLHVGGNVQIDGTLNGHPALDAAAVEAALGADDEIVLLVRGASPRWQRAHAGPADEAGRRFLYIGGGEP